MGIEIDRTAFSEADFARFRGALEDNLATLARLLAAPGFGAGPGSVGAELELYIVDGDGRPCHVNQQLQQALGDPRLALELNRYNLEYNLSPQPLAAQPFAAIEAEILDRLAALRAVAAQCDARVVPIGILPTLRQADFGLHCITDRKRYHALVAQLLQRRGGRFHIDIDGESPLRIDMSDITLEGANASFQVHYRVAPAQFADTYNAIQLVTPLALAVGANSPTLFGHRLWHETRVPLFKQSIDTRHVDRYSWNAPPRVNFGQGWIRHGALELFTEMVRLYPPLLPVCAGRSARAAGAAPALAELRLHRSTVWLWNRPVYDDADGGHLRVEMRALPAGPSALDMAANAAFLVGLAEGMRPVMADLLPAIPFGIAEYNFYRAAQFGLDARLVWPQPRQSGLREQPVVDIVRAALPLARQGLDDIGIDAGEAARYLAVIEGRLRRHRNGAGWQRRRLATLEQSLPRDAALHALLEEYIGFSTDNLPVSEWPP